MTVPYVEARRTPKGYSGTIIIDGVRRWSRDGKTAEELETRLKRCYPRIDAILTEEGVMDTGEISLAECIEAAAQQY